jgi:hypothetical protein
MADKKLNIKVRTDGAKRAKKELKGVEGGMAKLGKAAVVASAAFFGGRMLLAGLKNAIELSGKQELAEKKLATALGKTSQALLQQAAALQQVSMFGDEDIIMMQSMLASFVKGEEEIKLLTKATLDLASGMGLDLKSAGDLVAKTIGSSTNAMSRYGIEVTGAVGSTERLETLTNNVAKLFGGQALAQSQTMTGSIEQMKNAAGDAAEALGDLLGPMVISIAKKLKSAAEFTSDFLTGLKNIAEFGDAGGLEAIKKDNDRFVDQFNKMGRGVRGLKKELIALGIDTGAKEFKDALKDEDGMPLQLREQGEKMQEIIAFAKQIALEKRHEVDILRDEQLPLLKEVLVPEMFKASDASKKAAEFASQTAISLGTSAIMGDNVTESLKRAVIQLGLMVAQAKLFDFFMDTAKGFTPGGFLSTAVNFLFGKSPTQSFPTPNGGGSKITINQNFGGMGVIDHNFAANSIIPAINKAISTGQARIG